MPENGSLGLKNLPTLSFPSTFNNGGGNDLIIPGVTDPAQLQKLNKIKGTSKSANDFSSALQRIKTKNLSIKDVRAQYFTSGAMNISNYQKAMPVVSIGDPNNGSTNKVYYADPYKLPSDMLRSMNMYKFMWNKSTVEILESNKGKNTTTVYTSQTAAAPSLFNPKFNVQVIGMTYNVPLLNTDRSDGAYAIDSDMTDCSMPKLVELSNKNKLGKQTYRPVDFIFCKDYGKVSNNHMITLRRFSHPIGDAIGYPASDEFVTGNKGALEFDLMGDIAHLVTYFGTDDNKLEDIAKYEYKYTWKELHAERKDIESKEGEESRGLIGMFAKMNPSYNKMVNAGTAPAGASLLGLFAGSKMASFNRANDDALQSLRMYDNNKVYSPKQTIQDTHIPEGKIIFSHEFTLVFSYKLRAYENINPKSAFLDLLGNIHETTAFRGQFWGGSRPMIGPGPSNSQYQKAYNMIDNAFDKLGGVAQSLASGGFNLEEMMGSLSSALDSAGQAILNGFKNAKDNLTGNASSTTEAVKNVVNSTGLVDLLKGQLKNVIGRPSFYAYDSLLTDKLVGLWHVTIGNPRNPILSMGNLILMNSQIQHLGPLGLDDFPTEIKVTCTLKHATSRDSIGMQKMYTQGVNSIYMTKQRNLLNDYYIGGANNKEDYINNKNDKNDQRAIALAAKNARESISQKTSDLINNWGKVATDYQARIYMYGETSPQKLQLALDEIAPVST